MLRIFIEYFEQSFRRKFLSQNIFTRWCFAHLLSLSLKLFVILLMQVYICHLVMMILMNYFSRNVTKRSRVCTWERSLNQKRMLTSCMEVSLRPSLKNISKRKQWTYYSPIHCSGNNYKHSNRKTNNNDNSITYITYSYVFPFDYKKYIIISHLNGIDRKNGLIMKFDLSISTVGNYYNILYYPWNICYT